MPKKTPVELAAEALRKAEAEKPPVESTSSLEAPEKKSELDTPDQPWKQVPEWESKGLFLAFPCYKDTNPATAWALVALALDLGTEKMQMDIRMGDAMIYHARNQLVAAFLESEAQWLLFLDDDMVPPIGRPGFLKTVCRLPDSYPIDPMKLHVAHRLTSHNVSVVGATYFYRYPNAKAVNSLANETNYAKAASGFHDRIMEAEWVGTGCMMIKRQVFLDIQEAFPNLRPENPNMPFNYFHPGEDGSGEDVSFCRRARAAGHKVFVDCRLHALHVGRTAYGVQTSQIGTLAR